MFLVACLPVLRYKVDGVDLLEFFPSLLESEGSTYSDKECTWMGREVQGEGE